MSTKSSFARSDEAKKAGWISRRYRSSVDREEGTQKLETKREAERVAAEAKADMMAKRTPKERLAILDARFGNGVGAQRERPRLGRVIEEQRIKDLKAKMNYHQT
jgi:hypothetical protein